jgi:hypothetical protein
MAALLRAVLVAQMHYQLAVAVAAAILEQADLLVVVVVVGQLQLSELAQLEPIIYLPVALVVVRVQITAMVMVRLQEKILVVM